MFGDSPVSLFTTRAQPGGSTDMECCFLAFLTLLLRQQITAVLYFTFERKQMLFGLFVVVEPSQLEVLLEIKCFLSITNKEILLLF